MSTIADLTVPVEEFALSRTLQTDAALSTAVRPVVAPERGRVMPYVWLDGEDVPTETVAAAMEDDRSVESATMLASHEGRRLYRIHWSDRVETIVRSLTGEGATILEAATEGRRWRLRLAVPERNALSRTYEAVEDRDLQVTVERIQELDHVSGGTDGLTATQYETLVAALEHGYYRIPREVDMEELASVLGVSHQALSERLRRAHRRLVEESVAGGTDLEDDE